MNKTKDNEEVERPKPMSIIHQVSRLASKMSPSPNTEKSKRKLSARKGGNAEKLSSLLKEVMGESEELSATSNVATITNSLEITPSPISTSRRRLDIPSTVEFHRVEDKEIRRLLAFQSKTNAIF